MPVETIGDIDQLPGQNPDSYRESHIGHIGHISHMGQIGHILLRDCLERTILISPSGMEIRANSLLFAFLGIFILEIRNLIVRDRFMLLPIGQGDHMSFGSF